MSLAQLRLTSGCVHLWQIFRAPLIRDAKDLDVFLQIMATGANEHPCAVAPLGYILVPELPQYLQVLSISNSFCIHIGQRWTSSKTFVELCKDIFNHRKKNFTKRDSLFCDSFFPVSCVRCLFCVCLYANGDTPCGKRNVPAAWGSTFWEQMSY